MFSPGRRSDRTEEFRVTVSCGGQFMITDTVGCFAAALKGVFLQCSGVGLLFSSIDVQAILHANFEWTYWTKCLWLEMHASGPSHLVIFLRSYIIVLCFYRDILN